MDKHVTCCYRKLASHLIDIPILWVLLEAPLSHSSHQTYPFSHLQLPNILDELNRPVSIMSSRVMTDQLRAQGRSFPGWIALSSIEESSSPYRRLPILKSNGQTAPAENNQCEQHMMSYIYSALICFFAQLSKTIIYCLLCRQRLLD